MFDISAERPGDGAAIEALLDAAFDPGRQAKVSYRYREGVAPAPFSRLVARENDRLVGCIRCWPIMVDGADRRALLLGPLAVDAGHRGLGIGAALVGQVLDQAQTRGYRLVFLVGDLGYYQRFGFEPAAPRGFEMPGERPERLLVRALLPGALATTAGVLSPWRWVRRRGRMRMDATSTLGQYGRRIRGRSAGYAQEIEPSPNSDL